ncbi:hypothetical protein M8C21_033369 [Ambrosia artemisiifolia]|uniref:General negative regulator of transcription subunit 3 n=1 Tax=Ambrosia artemisiifolia TaxID=4212 RepID=A0AAD5D8D9_AMBAR|nr:hypothetical protein M8C21_033369 [Ambrosia artemisiifolia]
MGASRKLQGEIDRVLKKVQEGVEVYDTDNANQKEKFEADLKKEIKKLQRIWLEHVDGRKVVSASYEQALVDARKLIEREMERFKICEKETKTKAFSKEGLGQQPKTDPKEKAKSETRDWLNNTVSELESQIDSFEAEMEGLPVKKGKTRPPRLTHLESSITRHKAHIMKLELILRLLDNDELSPEQVNDVKYFIDDYVERNQEDFDEFEDVDMLYNSLPLDMVDALEDLVSIVPPSLVKGVGVGSTGTVLNVKNALSSPPLQSPVSLNTGRGSLTSQSIGSPASNISTSGVASSVSEMGKRNILRGDERVGASSGSMVHSPPVSSLSSRMMLSQGAAKTSDGGDNGNGVEATGMPPRVFSPSWRPGSPFQNQHEGGQVRGRPEIAPDQREKFLQRFQQVQQQTQFSAQQSPLLQQFNSQSSNVLPPGGLGGAQSAGLNTVTSGQQPSSIHLQSGQQTLISAGSKDTESNAKADEMEQQQSLSDDLAADSAQSVGLSKNAANEEDPKVSYALDMQSGASTEATQSARDVDLSPGQPFQSNQSGSLGVIGRRSHSDLGTIGDNLSGLAMSQGGTHDQQYNLQMLESAFYKLPQPRDSERAKSYTARHPAVTPQSYPQVQAPTVNNPAFWERLGSDNIGTDTLFFSFYYQQNTYQQYLAAKELKKQSWRYHKKYNTWFQRHEEPKFSTDDYEQGTYVYFDFHIGNDEMQNGWCQRIKTDFKFEYNFLEDEVTV